MSCTNTHNVTQRHITFAYFIHGYYQQILLHSGKVCIKDLKPEVALESLKQHQEQQQQQQPQDAQHQQQAASDSSQRWYSWVFGRSISPAAVTAVPVTSSSPPQPVQIRIPPAQRDRQVTLADPLNWSCYCGSSVKVAQAC